jgi:hypothetical protein
MNTTQRLATQAIGDINPPAPLKSRVDRRGKHGNPVELATRGFASACEATAFFREMLHRYQPGDRVTAEDSVDLWELLQRHPERIQKIGTGISRFEVMDDGRGHQCFRLVRVDMSSTDFSYLCCVRGQAPSQKQQVALAFREVVRHDIIEAMERFFAEHADGRGMVTCGETGERIGRADAHVDHLQPLTFEVLVTTFLAARGLSWEDAPLTPERDNQFVPAIADAALAADFRRFHGELARLDIIKSEVNLSRASRYRIKAGRIAIGGVQ